MPPSINPATREVTIPKSDLTLVSGTLYTLNTESFRSDMNALLDNEEYIWLPDWAARNAPVTVGGITLAQTIEMINGFSLTFDDSGGTDQYSVRLEGSNNNLFDIQNGILNQNLVQVIPTNSAGLTFSKEIEDLSYNGGRVFLNTADGAAGTAFPNGTTVNPVNNITDAQTIVTTRSLPKSILLEGSVTLTTEDISEYNFLGGAATHDTINLGSATTSGAVFENMKLQGTANGVIHCKDCVLENLSGFEGFLVGGAVGGTLSLVGESHIVNAHAASTGTDDITIDYQGNNIACFLPGWEGAMTIINHSHASTATAIDMRSGEITLDSSVTAGIIVVRGVGKLIDNSAGATVINMLVEPDAVQETWQRLGLDPNNPQTTTTSAITFDDVTVVISGDGETTSTLTRSP